MNWVIVVAGGKGKRIKREINKIFFPLLGRPIIYHTLKVLESCKTVKKVIITVRKDDLGRLRDLVKQYHFQKVVDLVVARTTRQDSTFNVLKRMKKQGIGDGDLIGIHNAVNSLVTAEEIKKVFEVAKKIGGALLAIPARDTVKITGASNLVQQTPIRKFVWYAQTPQVGKFGEMLKAFEKAKKDNFQGTDDTQLLERIGVKVKVVPCSSENFKITYPEDLILAEDILKRRKE